MVRDGDGAPEGPLDGSAFAERRQARDIIDRLLDEHAWLAPEFEDAVALLERQRGFALRHLLKRLRANPDLDELLTLDLLARLVHTDDAAQLAELANDTQAPKAARVACTLVLLGQDRTDLIRDTRLSSMVLQWQAEYLSEEPSLRYRLMQLYQNGPRDQRASWIALQDRSVTDPGGRAAVFEMLLEVEDDLELRRFMIDALGKVSDATTLAALSRIQVLTRDEQEKQLVRTRIAQIGATLPAADLSGWSASIGYCDAAGAFSLRFERSGSSRRARRVTFVLDVQRGVREALTLTGAEMSQLQVPDVAEHDANGVGGTTFSIALPQALGLLRAAERVSGLAPDAMPSDYEGALRLLDPLAGVSPEAPVLRAPEEPARTAGETAELLDHPGYSGWCYDAGNRSLDELRLEFLAHADPGAPPSDEMLARAVERLRATDEPRRLRAMLQHNALVHQLAGEDDACELADAAARIIAHGGFAELTLVRTMIRRSLHPAFYFLSPYPALPNRADIAQLVVGSKRPTKARVFAVDLGLTLARAMDVWLSRVPARERPDAGTLHRAMVELARAGARIAPSLPSGDLRSALTETYSECLTVLDFPGLSSDPSHEELLAFLVDASTFLIDEICAKCPEKCLQCPREDGERALDPTRFPAGSQAESRLRGWPGRFLYTPAPELSGKLERFIHPDLQGSPTSSPDEPSPGPGPETLRDDQFLCALCEQVRPTSARSRTRFARHDAVEAEPICRRCQRRCRHDRTFQMEIARHGQVVEP